MVTKKEIEDECDAKIANFSTKLENLEQEHKQFGEEEKQFEEWYAKKEVIRQKLKELEDRQYIGNWGSSYGWNHGIIPKEFQFEGVSPAVIKSALCELRDVAMNDIVKTKEWQELSQQERILGLLFHFTPRHKAIHSQIQQLQDDISWWERRKSKVQTRAGLIQIAKNIAESERWTEQDRKKRADIEEIKRRIIAKTNNYEVK